MKLQTQLYLFPGSVIFLTLCILFSMYWLWKQSNTVFEHQNYITEINTRVHQLETNLYLYEKAPSLQYQKRWEAQHQALTRLLNNAPALPAEQQTLLNSIKGLNRGVPILFQRLLVLSQRPSEAQSPLKQHINEKLIAQLQTIIEDSQQLTAMVRLQMRDNSTKQMIVMGGLLLFGSALLTLLAINLSSRIRSHLDTLRGGVKELEAGNFQHQLDTSRSDEFGDFIEEFNSMKQTLEETTISRDALQKEIDQRTYALKHIASTDPLTQVFNRRKLQEQAELEIARSRRHDEPLSVLLFDADHFKSINDKFGHSVGDLVLIHLCRLSESVMRENDLIARYGGEEFVILLPHTDLHGANELAARIQSRLKDYPFRSEEEIIPLTVSIGIACLQPETSFADLIRDADKALYDAKESGRNCIKSFKPLNPDVDSRGCLH